jgi:hypothetical protein
MDTCIYNAKVPQKQEEELTAPIILYHLPENPVL